MEENRFEDEIVPVDCKDRKGNEIVVDRMNIHVRKQHLKN